MRRFFSLGVAVAMFAALPSTPASAAVNYNSSKSNSGNKMATPKPKATPTPRSHMAVKGSGVPTCANGIRYVSSTGAVICNSRVATPKVKASHKP